MKCKVGSATELWDPVLLVKVAIRSCSDCAQGRVISLQDGVWNWDAHGSHFDLQSDVRQTDWPIGYNMLYQCLYLGQADLLIDREF